MIGSHNLFRVGLRDVKNIKKFCIPYLSNKKNTETISFFGILKFLVQYDIVLNVFGKVIVCPLKNLE